MREAVYVNTSPAKITPSPDSPARRMVRSKGVLWNPAVISTVLASLLISSADSTENVSQTGQFEPSYLDFNCLKDDLPLTLSDENGGRAEADPSADVVDNLLKLIM